MREIRFRGKRVDDGKWFYGCLSYVDSRCQKIGSGFGNSFICQVQHSWQKTDSGYNIGWWIQVETKTVGQFTGLHDKNGVEIYEGDFVKIIHKFNKTECVGAVVFEEFQWFAAGEYAGVIEEYYIIEVIGNIHEVEEDET